MYYDTSPAGLYQEYESRVAAAVLKQKSRHNAQPVLRTRGLMWLRFRARLIAERDRLARHLQPAEEGYIA
jgi:hypothetical protein